MGLTKTASKLNTFVIIASLACIIFGAHGIPKEQMWPHCEDQGSTPDGQG